VGRPGSSVFEVRRPGTRLRRQGGWSRWQGGIEEGGNGCCRMLAGSGHRHERFSQAGAALLVEVADVFALVVI